MTHRHARLRCAAAPLLAPLVLALADRRVGAQVAPPAAADPTIPGVRVGDRVRFSVLDSGAPGAPRRCDGQVVALAGDTVVVAGTRRCPRGDVASAGPLRIARGARGSRLTHTFLGVLGGAAVGGLAGRLAAGDGCRVPGCSDGGFAVGAFTAVGVYAGALGGGVVGLLLPAGPRWAHAGAPGPLRVAGLALRPGGYVALGRAGRRR